MKKFINDLIHPTSNKSTMRISILMVVLVTCIGLLFIQTAVAISILKGKLASEMGIATIIGADTTILIAMIYGKYKQKEIENKNESE